MPAKSHGASATLLYGIWKTMKSRCLNPNVASYKNYGGRGITICKRWQKDFLAFAADVGPRPSKNHVLDRIDNNKGYKPGNVRWVTRLRSAQNMRSNKIVAGLPLAEAARRAGLQPQTLGRRLNRRRNKSSLSDAEALTLPKNYRGRNYDYRNPTGRAS